MNQLAVVVPSWETGIQVSARTSYGEAFVYDLADLLDVSYRLSGRRSFLTVLSMARKSVCLSRWPLRVRAGDSEHNGHEPIPRVREASAEVLKSMALESTGTADRIRLDVERLLADRYGPGAVELSSRSTTPLHVAVAVALGDDLSGRAELSAPSYQRACPVNGTPAQI